MRTDDTADQKYGDMSQRQLPIILALGTTQTLAWASSYYLPAILADPMARDLGISSNWIFGAFSASLVISALLGPRIGRQIDLVGGRQVLSVSNLTIAAGLVLLGLSQSVAVMAIAWLLLGIGMGWGFTTPPSPRSGASMAPGAQADHRHHADGGLCLDRRLAADRLGLAHIGWRDTCFAWAAAHHPDRPAAQFLHAADDQGRQAGRGDSGEAASAARPHHDPARLRLRRGLDRHRRDGGAFPAHPRGTRRDAVSRRSRPAR